MKKILRVSLREITCKDHAAQKKSKLLSAELEIILTCGKHAYVGISAYVVDHLS